MLKVHRWIWKRCAGLSAACSCTVAYKTAEHKRRCRQKPCFGIHAFFPRSFQNLLIFVGALRSHSVLQDRHFLCIYIYIYIHTHNAIMLSSSSNLKLERKHFILHWEHLAPIFLFLLFQQPQILCWYSPLHSCFWVAISARYLLTDGEYLRTTDLWRGGNVRAVLEAGNNWLQPTR